ncbi:phytanoyl-CoA dioxygenase family protein [Nitzschia inconspicua]|uniref:Phytanoyl-CoA dioxygenase family protein n=1 Tax=Nitzschia inconspicua TaxID=303405 RepID=A0A9K3KWR4_9STRA|nr:phytanoyl-CoA dioxygenase family protein [Nitzschia inconspicua]
MENRSLLENVTIGANERTQAAKRIVQATLEGIGRSEDASILSSSLLVADLKLLLNGTLDESEIMVMVGEVQTKTKSKTTSKISPQSSPRNADVQMFSADRHAARILDAHESYDCLQREFDVNDPTFDTDEAASVLEKCRILVLRNVFSEQILQRTLSRYQQFTKDVRSGRIHRDGTTTYGGDYFILKEDKYRLNYMIPRELASEDILANEHVLEILSHYRLLDEDFIVNHSGTLNAQPGAPPQAWHADAEYLYGDRSFEEFGIAGQDLPPFAISMFTPLLKMTHDHGPTEFCLGTAHFRGYDSNVPDQGENRMVGEVITNLHQWDQIPNGRICPEGFRRTPLLGLGDVVLFDYMLSHRGGANKSNDLRSMLFTVYSRKWYKDWTFDISNDEDETEFQRLTKTTRFAVIQTEDI